MNAFIFFNKVLKRVRKKSGTYSHAEICDAMSQFKNWPGPVSEYYLGNSTNTVYYFLRRIMDGEKTIGWSLQLESATGTSYYDFSERSFVRSGNYPRSFCPWTFHDSAILTFEECMDQMPKYLPIRETFHSALV